MYLNGFNMQPSSLYHLKPIGIGTPHVESLSGYIKRLAEAHKVSVGVLLKKEIIPYIEKFCRGSANRFLGEEVRYLNGFSGLTEEIVRVIGEKTCNEALNYLTLSLFEDNLHPRHMLRKYHAWCPICFEESKAKGEELYDQLIWNFSDIEICKKHQVMLVDKCPYCNKKGYILTSSSRVGFCSFCGYWLGSKSCKISQDVRDIKEWHDWAYDSVGKLLALAPTLQLNGHSHFSKNIINLVSSSNASLRKLASNVNVSHEAFTHWISGQKPSLRNLLTLSYRFQCSMVDLLVKDIVSFNGFDNLKKGGLPPKETRPKIDFQKLKSVIDDAINTNSGLSIKQISTLTGISSEVIVRNFPNEITLIKKQFQEHLEQLKAEKLLLIRNTMIALHSRGIYPSMKALGREMGKRVIINDEERKLWISTLEELGYEVEL